MAITSAIMREKLRGKKIVRIGEVRSERIVSEEPLTKLDMVIQNFRRKYA